MPSIEQIKELQNYCYNEKTTINGADCQKFTSKSNGCTIFLPAAGKQWVDGLIYAGSGGHYWSSTKASSNSSYLLCFNSSNTFWNNGSRRDGHTIRPVSK